MDSRSFESLTLMSKCLEGTLSVLSPGLEQVHSVPPGHSALNESKIPFGLQVIQQSPAGVRSTGQDLVYALHSVKSDYVTRSSIPYVLTSEQTLPMRVDLNRAELTGFDLARAAAGLVPREFILRRQVLNAEGLQCNGPASGRWYGWMKRDTLNFHDSRIRQADVLAASSNSAWAGVGHLRLGFSGRLIKIKGPQFAIHVASEAHRRGLPVNLHIFGTGPMESELQRLAPPNVTFEGFREFQTEWVSEVREEIDIMLFPHVQGDPSCTYFESLGSGAPILAFDNATATPLVRANGFGWTVPQRDVSGMVDVIENLLADPSRISFARERGLKFMQQHNFESTTQRRAEHLMQFVR